MHFLCFRLPLKCIVILHFISSLDPDIYLPLVGQSSEENLAHTFIYTQDMHH